MADLLKELQHDIKEEQQKKRLVYWLPRVLTAATIAICLFAAWSYVEYRKGQRSANEGVLYQEALDLSVDNPQKSQKILTDIAMGSHSVYAPLALQQLWHQSTQNNAVDVVKLQELVKNHKGFWRDITQVYALEQTLSVNAKPRDKKWIKDRIGSLNAMPNPFLRAYMAMMILQKTDTSLYLETLKMLKKSLAPAIKQPKFRHQLMLLHVSRGYGTHSFSKLLEAH